MPFFSNVKRLATLTPDLSGPGGPLHQGVNIACRFTVTARIIRDEVHGETGDAEERAEPRRLG
jgi:hypothetical protein